MGFYVLLTTMDKCTDHYLGTSQLRKIEKQIYQSGFHLSVKRNSL